MLDSIWPKLLDLQDCLCASLEDTVEGIPCRCCVVSGANPAWDDCHCEPGTAWVRLAGISPSTRATNCPPGMVSEAYTIRVDLTVLRCAPTVSKDDVAAGRAAPDCQCLRDKAESVSSDFTAMVNAVACCGLRHAKVTGYRPLGGQGGCVGGTVEATFEAMACVDCETSPTSPGES